MPTYFANDLSGIGQLMAADQARRIAAQDSFRNYLSRLDQTNADRYRTTQDTNARMFQTNAYRDVAQGETAARLKGIESNERIAGMPYERIPLERQRYFELLEKHPELMGNPQVVRDREQRKADTASAATIATQKLRAALPAIRDDVAQVMDSYSKLGSGIFGTGIGGGLWQSDANSIADRMAAGTFVPSPDDSPAVRAGWKRFNDLLTKAKVEATAGLEGAAGGMGYDPNTRGYFSGFNPDSVAAAGESQPPTPVPTTEDSGRMPKLPWYLFAPGAYLQASVIKELLRRPTPPPARNVPFPITGTNRPPPGTFNYTPNGGLVRTNAPPAF